MCGLVYILLFILGPVLGQDANCNFFNNITVGQTLPVRSPRYPQNYTAGVTCRWILQSPQGYNVRLVCNEIVLPNSPQCSLDRLLVSKSGDEQLVGADTYCGTGSLTAVSTRERMSIGLITSTNSPGGRFTCTVTAQIATTPPSCSCGYKKTNRIVGGVETDINEFPSMAGIVDVNIFQIKCGAVIIGSRYVLTAAHCVVNRRPSDTAVVVGEHDVTAGESNATQAMRVDSFRIHPAYNPNNYDNDAALVRTVLDILFGPLVGPICLPFKFVANTFAGAKVTALGWGTLFPGGPVSKVLRKVTLDVISQSSCQQQLPQVTPRQMCTFTPGKDACQDDSGGPLLYTDPATGLLFSVGIISFGMFCASTQPGINTRVTTLLDWILANTPGTIYCPK